MKISLPVNQFFDDAGVPLSGGRISIFMHDSDTLADVFTLDGDIYRAAENPIRTSVDGRIPTLFLEAQIVDVKIEKDAGGGNFELLDTFQNGFDFAQASNSTIIDGIAGLKKADTSLGVVNVYGYDESVMAPPRFFVWDPTCTNSPDGGIIVESESTETGRWILLWDDEKLPCSIYGISEGNEANISAFLGYPDYIGQWRIRTPRIPRFLSGNYYSDTTFTTPKSIYFDDGASFANANFVCYSAMVPANSGFVANFTFTGKNVSAHSSWFREAGKFFDCGALDLFIDSDNFFAGTTVSSVVTVTGRNLYGTGRIPLTFSGTGCVHFNGCNICARRFLDPKIDIVKFSNSHFREDWFISALPANFDFGKIADGHRLEFGPLQGNSLSLHDFGNADLYVKARDAYERAASTPDRTLNMEGRMLSDLHTDFFNEVRNATISGNLSIKRAGDSVILDGVECDGMATTVAEIVTVKNSSIQMNHTDSYFSTLNCENSSVGIFGGSAWTKDAEINADGCEWGASLSVNVDDSNPCKSVRFTECRMSGISFVHKNLVLKNCTLKDCKILVHPFIDSGVPKIRLAMAGCVYDSADAVRFDLADEQRNPPKDIVPELEIVGNTFPNAEGLGVWIRRSGLLTGDFLKSGSALGFLGNTGHCPHDSFAGIFSVFEQITTPDGSAYLSTETVRVFPKKVAVNYNSATDAERPSLGILNDGGPDGGKARTWTFVNIDRFVQATEPQDLCEFRLFYGTADPVNYQVILT